MPVVYLTAHSDPATLARAKLTGPFGYILKPFEERELATQIEMALYRHQADRQLRQQREWLRVTLTSIGDAVIATDADGRVTFVNPVAESLTGWKAEEAAGQPVQCVFRIVNEQTGRAAGRTRCPCLREGRAVELANHAALVTKDGRTMPIEDSAAPILDAAGQVIGAVLVFHDVTEKRRAEQQLRRSHDELETKVNERTAELAGTLEAMKQEVKVREAAQETVRAERQRFHDVLDILPAYVVLLAPDYHVPFANRFFEDRFGKSEGRRCYEYLFNRAEPCENCETYKVLKTGAPHRWEWTGPDGRNYDIYDFPFTDADGSPRIMEVGLDITEVRRAQTMLKEANESLERRVAERTAALAESEERFDLAMQAAQEGVWDWNVETGAVFYSPRYKQMLGYSEDEIEPHVGAWKRFLHPDDRERVYQLIDAVLRGEREYEVEFRVQHKDGHYLDILSRGFPVRRIPGGPIVRIVGIHFDLTERKRAEEALRKSEQEFAPSRRPSRRSFGPLGPMVGTSISTSSGWITPD